MVVIGPAPLLRHTADGRLELQEDGLTVLRRVGAPLHVVFTIGGSRCGKSTVCNALLGQDAAERRDFATGSSFDPVTSGVDVAAQRLPGGGALILADCEGAFHIMGSSLSARGFGVLGFLAYHLSSMVVHVTMGSIDERDIEALGHMAATAEGVSEECLRPANSKPELMLLVNGARFDLGEAVARRLLQPPEGAGRSCARGAIAAAFCQHPSLEALPCCEHRAYWPKVEDLRERILRSPAMCQQSGFKASGSQLAERLEQLLTELGQGAQVQADPVSAAEQAMRSIHLDPLVEDIAKKFTAAASTVVMSNGGNEDSRAVEEALKEFDERSAWLTASGSEGLPAPLLEAVKQRLAARLEGIAEAVQRGRRESAKMLRRASRTNQTPSRLSRSMLSEDLRTPTPPQTPNRRSTLAALLSGAESAAVRLEAWQSNSKDDLSELRKDMEDLTTALPYLPEVGDSEELHLRQEMWQKSFQDLHDRQRHQLKSWQSHGQEMLEELLQELQKVEVTMPDIVSATVMLEEARAELESLRLRRQKMLESSASTRVEQHLEELRQRCAEETGGYKSLQERVSSRLTSRLAGLQQFLHQEVQQRRERHQALVEVVAQMSKSLESTIAEDEAEAETLTPSPAACGKSSPSSGVSSRWRSEKRR